MHSATTGIASMNHQINNTPYGYTAHSRFGLPVDDDKDASQDKEMLSTLTSDSQRHELLRNADLIIWDELAMANRVRLVQFLISHRTFNLLQLQHQLDCADDVLRRADGLDPDLPFGGIRFIGCGDFHQVIGHCLLLDQV